MLREHKRRKLTCECLLGLSEQVSRRRSSDIEVTAETVGGGLHDLVVANARLSSTRLHFTRHSVYES
jgi:hypothetical protein